MARNETVLALGLAFAVGCAVAPVAQQYLVRPAGAAPAGVKRWEQYCSWQNQSAQSTWTDTIDEVTKTVSNDLKNRGQEGWELVSLSPVGTGVGTVIYCFKRPIP
jgi:hypothetical protein